MGRGRFITFEGPEGSGKSTQSKMVIGALKGLGYDVINPREPGSTRTGEMIRNILQFGASGEKLCSETELFLFEAARAQLVNNVIAPHLENGGFVVCDRFYDSTTAYQGGGRGINLEFIYSANKFASRGYDPDLTLLLDLPVETGMGRVRARGEKLDAIEMEAMGFHNKVRDSYLKSAENFPDRIAVIDATYKVDDVYSQIKSAFKQRLGLILQ